MEEQKEYGEESKQTREKLSYRKKLLLCQDGWNMNPENTDFVGNVTSAPLISRVSHTVNFLSFVIEKHILLIDIKFIGTCMVFWTYFVNQHDNYWVTNTTFTLYINLNCCHELKVTFNSQSVMNQWISSFMQLFYVTKMTLLVTWYNCMKQMPALIGNWHHVHVTYFDKLPGFVPCQFKDLGGSSYS